MKPSGHIAQAIEAHYDSDCSKARQRQPTGAVEGPAPPSAISVGPKEGSYPWYSHFRARQKLCAQSYILIKFRDISSTTLESA